MVRVTEGLHGCLHCHLHLSWRGLGEGQVTLLPGRRVERAEGVGPTCVSFPAMRLAPVAICVVLTFMSHAACATARIPLVSSRPAGRCPATGRHHPPSRG